MMVIGHLIWSFRLWCEGTVDREYTRAVRAVAQKSGWAVREGTLSQRVAGNALHVYDFAGWLYFCAKPLIWDDIFWNIMGIEFERKPSPSRHYWGHSCKVPRIAVSKFKGNTNAQRAEQVLDFAEASKATLPERQLTLSGLLSIAVGHTRADDYVETEVVNRFADSENEQARLICRDVLENRRKVSFRHNIVHDGVASSFFERALKWVPETE